MTRVAYPRSTCPRSPSALRLPLTRFEVETIELDSLDAAREALLCVRTDGMGMDEVAGRPLPVPARRRFYWRMCRKICSRNFSSVTPGTVLELISREECFHLCRIIAKAEPNVDDPIVKNAPEDRILERHFGELLCARHVHWTNSSHLTRMKATDDSPARRSSLFQFLSDDHFEKLRACSARGALRIRRSHR